MPVNADSAMLVISRALWNPEPTTDYKSELSLATALGYPPSWHVVREIENEQINNKCRANNNDSEKQPPPRLVIFDRIYAGNPSEGVDCYFNHHAAQTAAESWVEGESTGYDGKGGHLLPRKPKFSKGDQAKVKYEGEWLPATIRKRSEKREGYRYTVYYPHDDTEQKLVCEEDIELMDDPTKVAEDLGLSGWQAKLTGKKWKFTSPDGKTFTSKTAALKHKKKVARGKAGEEQEESNCPDLSEGDPPWRTTGHEYLGRRVKMSIQHQKSATRTVTVDQYGTVVGWIADTDVDTNGEPGFVSERTGNPANLFSVVFDDEPNHPYLSLLVQSQDLEEYELKRVFLPPQDTPPKKKFKLKSDAVVGVELG